MDGLLLNTEDYYYGIGCKICAKYGKNFSKKFKLKITGTTDIRAAEIIVEELRLPISPEDYRKQNEEMKSSTFDNINSSIVMPGVEKLLHHLHKNKIPFAVASGAANRTYRLLSQKLDKLFSLFHHTTLASSDPEVNHGKPAPDVFLICAQRFPDQPSPNKCLVFEDAPNGVAAAVKAGMQVVMVPPDYVSDDLKQQATLVLNSLEDFHPEWFGLPSY